MPYDRRSCFRAAQVTDYLPCRVLISVPWFAWYLVFRTYRETIRPWIFPLWGANDETYEIRQVKEPSSVLYAKLSFNSLILCIRVDNDMCDRTLRYNKKQVSKQEL